MYRFFVEPNQIGEESIVIVGKDVNHIKNVLRMKIGETILISDGSDKEYICSVEKIADDEITAKIEDINGETRELPIKVTLFQALPKGDKMETIIQKMVELGAYQIVPMSTKRSVVKLDAKKAVNKVKRWNAIAESAAKQSKRGIIPEVAEVHTFKEAVEKAKELAKESGLDQVTLKYIYNNQRVGMPEVAIVIQQQLKAAGINVELQAMDSPSFFSMFFQWTSGDASTEWDLGTNGWDSLQGDPSTQIVMYATNPQVTNCSQETIDMINAAIAEPNEELREQKFLEFQQLIQDDFTIYPISCPNYVWVTQKGVTGLDTINSMVPFEDWTLIDVA